jgi:hypothetical protein
MSSWNHRVVRFKGDEDWYEICEVYYEEDGSVFAHTAKGVSVCGENIAELRETLERMLRCLDQDILDEKHE